MTEPRDSVVAVRDLVVEIDGGHRVLDGVSLELRVGEVVGVVGESGSGKTTLALAMLGRTRGGARITSGIVEVAGRDVVAGSSGRGRTVRGKLVSYVPQDPGGALNPCRRVGPAIAEVMKVHGSVIEPDDVAATLRRVHLPDEPTFQQRFPHQLSGGQQQRVVIGMATAMAPPVVVFDEPTTGLDVVTQAGVLAEIKRMLIESGMTAMYISHDLAVVGSLTTRLIVMYAGRVIEEGPTAAILDSPAHPYTANLIACTPDHRQATHLKAVPGVPPGVTDRPTGCAFRTRCEHADERCLVTPVLEAVRGSSDRRVACFHPLSEPIIRRPRASAAQGGHDGTPRLSVTRVTAKYHARGGDVVAAQDVTFEIFHAECVALVGESGSGKTTLGRCVVGLHPFFEGTVALNGKLLPVALRARTREDRRRVQLIFQNPYDSLNPQRRVLDQIARAAVVLRAIPQRDANSEAAEILELVRLPATLGRRYPSELSGGERQRVAIARALIAKPDVLVCDEITSALDVSVQAAVIELLAELQRSLGLGMLFITHDLGVVASIADRVLVLEHGNVRESGGVEDVLEHPKHPYTVRLLDAAPSLENSVEA